MLTTTKHVSKTGHSLALILPKIWIEHHGLAHKDSLKVSFLENGELLVEVTKNETRNETRNGRDGGKFRKEITEAVTIIP